MKQYWSSLAQSLTPYTPGEQPKIQNLIKLNTNENPYPPSPRVKAAIAGFASDTLRLYPDPESLALREAIARRHGVTPEMVFVGNGSDEVLALCFQAFFDRDKEAAFPDITYSFYEVYADLFGIPCEKIPLTETFELDVARFCNRNGGVIFANPNAPTGICLPLTEIERIVASNSRAVIVDEAYVEFGGESAVALLEKYPNLLVVKTFSKSHSLAGLRVGYAMGQSSLIQALECVKNSFNSYPLDKLAQAAAAAAMEDEPYCQECLGKIVEVREKTRVALCELGFEVLKSSSNFLFARHPQMGGAEMMAKLRKKGIIVRRFEKERIADFLRITIGTEAQMETLLKEVRQILG